MLLKGNIKLESFYKSKKFWKTVLRCFLFSLTIYKYYRGTCRNTLHGLVNVMFQFYCLDHLRLVPHIKNTGKQCRPRSDAAERGVWSGSTLFALNIGISIKHGNNKKKLTRTLPASLPLGFCWKGARPKTWDRRVYSISMGFSRKKKKKKKKKTNKKKQNKKKTTKKKTTTTTTKKNMFIHTPWYMSPCLNFFNTHYLATSNFFLSFFCFVCLCLFPSEIKGTCYAPIVKQGWPGEHHLKLGLEKAQCKFTIDIHRVKN